MIHPEALRHRLHRLALPIREQATHIQLTVGPLIRPADRFLQHLRGEFDQPGPKPRQFVSSHTMISTNPGSQST
jgi:hypothetical protein